MRQDPNESIVYFVHQLKERARYCEFERLGTSERTTEDELIMLCLIEGMHDPYFKNKLLEMLQSVNLTVETCIEFVQQLELIKKEMQTAQTNTKFYAKTVANGMSGKKNNCPAFSKTCSIQTKISEQKWRGT